MKIIYLNEQDNLFLKPSCVALGFFDGFHLGHLKLVKEVISVAKKNDLKKNDLGWWEGSGALLTLAGERARGALMLQRTWVRFPAPK